jgi:hypothetical protein
MPSSLYYFNYYAKAEPIRMLLHHAKVPYHDIRITKEQLYNMKSSGKLPAGQVPIWQTESGTVYH